MQVVFAGEYTASRRIGLVPGAADVVEGGLPSPSSTPICTRYEFTNSGTPSVVRPGREKIRQRNSKTIIGHKGHSTSIC